MSAHFWQRPMKEKNILKFAKLSAIAAHFFFTSLKGESLGCPNHGNIDSCCQFHQRKMHTFFVRMSILAAFSSYCQNGHSYKKFVRRMLMKLTAGNSVQEEHSKFVDKMLDLERNKLVQRLKPGVNFTNVLQAAFMCANPKSKKRH